jgi:hypothetical protein
VKCDCKAEVQTVHQERMIHFRLPERGYP